MSFVGSPGVEFNMVDPRFVPSSDVLFLLDTTAKLDEAAPQELRT